MAKLIFFLSLTLIISTACSNNNGVDYPPTDQPLSTATPSSNNVSSSPDSTLVLDDSSATPDEIIPIEPIECHHFWSRPTCESPQVCLDCGLIDGEPLPHELTDATYHQPSICLVCNEVFGEPLEPNFTANGLRINTTAGRSFDFHSVTNLDPSVTTVGTAALLFVDIFESEPGFRPIAGFEYIRARIMMVFDDEAAADKGFQYVIGHLDYYSMNLNDPSLPFDELEESSFTDFRISNNTLNFHGENLEYFVKYEEIMDAWVDDVAYAIREYIFLVPAGFDGIIIYLSSGATWDDNENRVLSDNIDENTLFFRLASQTQ